MYDIYITVYLEAGFSTRGTIHPGREEGTVKKGTEAQPDPPPIRGSFPHPSVNRKYTQNKIHIHTYIKQVTANRGIIALIPIYRKSNTKIHTNNQKPRTKSTQNISQLEGHPPPLQVQSTA